ncbi:MAG: MarC family protein [Luteibaculaceae bacterium]
MTFSLEETLKATIVLFAVIDILGSLPIIIDLKAKHGPIPAFRATFAAFIFMASFLAFGTSIINFLGINISAFAVAGSLVLFFLALEMILGHKFFKEEETSVRALSIVPIAFPLIAGAGTITTILSLKAIYDTVNIFIAVILNLLLVYAVLKLAKPIANLIGPGGLLVLKKIFGVILLAIAVKLFSENISGLFVNT